MALSLSFLHQSAVMGLLQHVKMLTPKPARGSSCAARAELQTSSGLPEQNGSYTTTTVPTHKVTVHDRERGVFHEFLVPEDQYILHTAEDQNISLPFACRHGCCTSCAVRVKSGELRQPEALGISAELKAKGYALLCVGFPSSDLEVETQDEDEVYWLQFGRYFARGPIERDDYALELAMGDE
ncbi:Ferredoxin c 2 protein [Thalictrum thalictroides]|uniref:Ferredoxin n=1 Tax=Thalictrum thalictroides TaxID=46969 RepID=A0A7J6XFD0_THATH|nr:Ferredoxin c 2 protein [Thalictrum thalictroides]